MAADVGASCGDWLFAGRQLADFNLLASNSGRKIREFLDSTVPQNL